MYEYVDNISKEMYINEANKNYFSKKTLSVEIVDNGYILPMRKISDSVCGGVLDSDKNYVSISSQLAFNMKNRVNGSYNIDNFNIRYNNETVVYFNYYYEHWGHFLIDMVSRLWYIIEEPNKYKLAVPVEMYSKLKISSNYLEFLRLFGIKDSNIIIINEPTKFKRIIIPECSIYPGKYYTIEYKKIFDYLINKVNVDESLPKKIYLSRKNFKKAQKKEKGERNIEKIFLDNGFTSIYPENISFLEQLKYYKSCKEMICINGTLSHNILFLNKDAKVIIINKTYKINKNQELINQLSKNNITYIDCHISLFPIAYGKGPFIIYKSKNMKRFLKEKHYKDKHDYLILFKLVYYKIWYILKYFSIYKFNIYHDKYFKDLKTSNILKYYLFR